MKLLIYAPAAALVALLSAPIATADPGLADPGSAPHFVEHTEWTTWAAGLSSLRVYPTPAARAAALNPGTPQVAEQAWTEVLARSPGADSPGMRAQFFCHWQLAELVQPGKTSWNLEPWRPVVADAEMVASGCNPGSAEEPF
ncbi:hypothetical protein A5634_25665 [Mycobacterium asiaticum]|uniref:DUF2599 domain-containing protein n=1 Tax=Mycobacterium asiaticum TaxID=1790 RepID=A0A1A3NZH9_MYCAS|nr:DUF2599 domain-containing protein [Mycobacterium asiaticum]OBK25762.1 hypothetical protein A5634_25665 [Mycobacterium asiaticum]